MPSIDFSLYRLANSTEPPPQTLTVSSTTLLSVVKSVIDLLIEQQIAATLWLKLPPGEIWSEIQRYHQQVGVSHVIYICSPKPQQLLSITSNNDAKKHSDIPSPIVAVELSPNSISEYFLLVLSPQFCSLILAQPTATKPSIVVTEAVPSSNKPQQVIYSFEARVIKRVLDGLRRAIAASQIQLTTSESNLPNVELLSNWDSAFFCPPVPEPLLLAQLLAKQIRYQEEIWHSAIANRAATALELQNQELLNTLRLKDEFLSNLCQELRTPLTNMKTALSLLNSPLIKPPQRQRYLHLLNTECDRQNSLITGFLELVQLDLVAEQAVLQPIRLSDIVPGVVSTYQPLAQEKGIMLAYTVPVDLPTVSCTGAWLKQIVINLLHNSIKFTPPGGQVWVRSRLQGDYVQLEFRDTGIGIAANEIPKIFDRFYRVRSSIIEDSGGAGLGLTMAQQLLLRCSGSISVKSKLGEGSIFNVLLPIAASSQVLP